MSNGNSDNNNNNNNNNNNDRDNSNSKNKKQILYQNEGKKSEQYNKTKNEKLQNRSRIVKNDMINRINKDLTTQNYNNSQIDNKNDDSDDNDRK